MKKLRPAVVVDESKCCGCKLCQLICQYYHTETCGIGKSSVIVEREIHEKGWPIHVRILNKDEDGRPKCDRCFQCVKYCPTEAIKLGLEEIGG